MLYHLKYRIVEESFNKECYHNGEGLNIIALTIY